MLRRIQVDACAWRKVEGLMADRKISRKEKGKVLGSWVMQAYLYGLEIVALTEKQQRLQVCINNWVRRLAGMEMVDRRMAELR